jgi:hypothetical protein
MNKRIANKLVYARPSFAPHDVGYEDIGTCSDQEGLTFFEHAALEITRGFCSNPGYANDSPTQTARDAIEQVKALIDELANEKI